MKAEEIIQLIQTELGADAVVSQNTQALQPYFYVSVEKLIDVLRFLKNNEQTYFDLLSCVTGIDNGVAKGTMEIVYTLFSIPNAHSIHVRVELNRENPEINTATFLWKTAEWHEREIFDLLGIKFIGHPDLRRILLPANWQGYPLRKDYIEQETYHGVKVKY